MVEGSPADVIKDPSVSFHLPTLTPKLNTKPGFGPCHDHREVPGVMGAMDTFAMREEGLAPDNQLIDETS
jgi:hypothetical protein